MNRILVFLVVLVIASIGATLYARYSGRADLAGDTLRANRTQVEHEAPLRSPPQTGTPQAGSSEISVELVQSAGQERLPPLPEADTPLEAQLAKLLQRAEAGDPVATCRITIAFNHCAEQARHKSFTARMRQSLEKGEGPWDDLLIETISRFEEPVHGLPSFCEGLDFSNPPDTGRLVRKNYHALSPRQKTLMVLTRPDGGLRRVHRRSATMTSALYVLPEYLAENSVSMLQEAYAAGDPLALEGLILLYAPGQALAPESVAVWQPNPRLFLKYSWIMRDLFGLESLGIDAAHLMRATAAIISREAFESIRREVEIEVERWRALELSNPRLLDNHKDLSSRNQPFDCSDG